ncbi:MAG: DUF1553 domain-containing protein [Pirellula sp.]
MRSWIATILMFVSSLTTLGRVDAAESVEMLVLMNGSGKVERYDLASGNHLGTLLSGLPPSNAILIDVDGRLLISTGLPGGAGTVLRYDPRGDGRVETLLDIPEGYGGRLFRATGMTWFEGDLLVASQGDGKVKRYSYPSGEWKADSALASPGGITQIAVHDGRLFVTDFVAQALRRASEELDGSVSDIWAQRTAHAPWGLAFDKKGVAYWSTSANRILRFDGKETVEWAGVGGELNTPIGIAIGPDGLIYAANLNATVSVWPSDAASNSGPLRVLSGPEMKSPISFAFAAEVLAKEFAYTPAAEDSLGSTDSLAFFESKIRPLLIARCIECHGETSQEGGLRLDTRHAWEKGGESGPAIRSGKPEDSLLIKAIHYADKDLKMPPDKQLSIDEIALLSTWIRHGAIDPRQDAGVSAPPTTNAWAEEFQKRLDWWSLKPLAKPEPPILRDNHWSELPVDRFILAALERANLQPAPAAEPAVLLRRLAIVLTGLPPTPTQRETFLQHWQVNPNVAYEKLVDEFLDSPHFGEHFARHWMDAVRYTDTYGYEWDVPAKGAYEYRDYLIRAFNGDVGFDVFLREQLAGDLLPQPRVNTELGINESIIGPMFYHMGEHRHGSSLAYNGVHQEMVSNKIDAFSKVFLATTVACAKCHDHKLEAVSQKDYYALGAVFMTPRWVSRPADAPGKNDGAIAKLKELRSAIRDEIAKQWMETTPQSTIWHAPLQAPNVPQPTIDDISFPLAKLIAANVDVESTWNALKTEWATTRAARIKGNESFQVLTDFALPQIPSGWVTDGDGMKHGWVEEATPLIALDGESIISRILPRGYHTHSLSSKLPGALRMPPENLVPGQFVSLKLAGGEFGGYLQMDENSILHEGVSILNQVQPTWRTIGDTPMKGGVTKVTFDFVTSSLNPNFPARVGVVPGLPNHDLGYDKRSWLSVTGIATHDVGGTPQDTLDAFESLYASLPPKTVEEVNDRVTAWFTTVIQRWCEGHVLHGDRQVIEWLLSHNLLPNQAAADSRLAQLMREYRAVEQNIAFPRSVNSMDERDVAKSGLHLNIRGNYDALGELVMPDSLQMFAGRNDVAKSAGSGRLELADSLLHPEHPLTSRVYVNRVWQWVFGTGLVTTPDDFGRLGDKPSNPELLDWLASDFVREGWATKKLIRQLLLTETFRQSGKGSEDAKQRDPANRLLHHYPTRRLEAESIRDAMLKVSGRLDDKLYGRSINPFRPAEDGAKRLFSGPLDGDGRRSLYLTMSIMAPPKVLTTFDLPDLRLPSGKRNVTNVPSQSLMMLNDPLVSILAKHWALKLLNAPHNTPEERVNAMFIAAFARAPQKHELQQWTTAAKDFSTTPDLMKDEAAWTQLAHTFFNTQEFIHYR